MTWLGWIEILGMEQYSLYVWGSYLVLPALVLVEVSLLLIRKREIYGHLGWDIPARMPAASATHPADRPEPGGGQSALWSTTDQIHQERRLRQEERRSFNDEPRSPDDERRTGSGNRRSPSFPTLAPDQVT